LNIAGSNVLVTGGAGLIGSHIADDLVREGASVTVYDSFVRGRSDHLTWACENGDVRIVEADIRDVESLRREMEDVDFVFHEAATWLRLCEAEPRKAVEVNILGTFNVLEACVEAGVKKVVAASSSSVYGEGSYLPTDEKHPFNNDLFYGATKVADEQLLRAFHKKYGLDFVGLRYLNVYGPRQPFQAAYMDVIMHFLNRIDAGEPPVIHGDGTQTVDLVFVADVARANLLALKSEVTDDFFNVASGVQTSLNELAEILLDLKGRPDLSPVYETRDAKLVTKRHGCPLKARERLGFEATTSPREGLRRVIEWREQVRAAQAEPALN
jgi:UDP-glucose 4-epimerase